MFLESTSAVRTSTTAAGTTPRSPASTKTAAMVPTTETDGKCKFIGEWILNVTRQLIKFLYFDVFLHSPARLCCKVLTSIGFRVRVRVRVSLEMLFILPCWINYMDTNSLHFTSVTDIMPGKKYSNRQNEWHNRMLHYLFVVHVRFDCLWWLMFVEYRSEIRTSTTAAETTPQSPASTKTATMVPTKQPVDGKCKFASEWILGVTQRPNSSLKTSQQETPGGVA